MMNFALHASLLVMAASGFQVIEEIAVASGFEVSGLSSETFSGETAIAKDPPALNGNETAMMEWNTGAPMPPTVQSFPGCQCDWNDPGWTCQGMAMYPRLMEGKECCCCGIHCKRGRRCTDDQCMSIGVDQGEEVREEERKWAEMLKNADFVLGDDLPAKIVSIGGQACNVPTIMNACRNAGGMTPVCDTTSYVAGQNCYTPGLKGTKYYNRHFSHGSISHRGGFELSDDVEAQFHGMCFLTSHGNNALAATGASHAWAGGSSGNSRIVPNAKAAARGLKAVTQNDLSACKPKEQGGIGCWRTLCVDREPNLAEAKSTGSYR